MRRATILAPLAMLVATPALLFSPSAMAQDRDYCPARPGMGDTACTISAGRVSVETGLADWQHDAGDDTFTLGDTLARLGIGGRSEIDLGWTPYVREGHASSTGDVTIAFRQNLRNPDGAGFSVALLPHATLPVGRAPGGAGDWGAGLELPASLDLGHGLSLQSTTDISAAADEDRHGRHFAISEVAGLGIDLSKAVELALEAEALRNEDPAGSTTQRYAGASLAWSVSDDLQLDLGVNAGLNRNSADAELYLGIARRF